MTLAAVEELALLNMAVRNQAHQATHAAAE
jgi:hypothetical protein